MPMIWNADADAKLFAAVLATSDVKIKYAEVAAMMGPECSAKAVIHRIGKIKDTAKKSEGGDSAASTPAKTPGKRGRPKANGADVGDETPTIKKPKPSVATKGKAKTQAPVGVKMEAYGVMKVKKEEWDATEDEVDDDDRDEE